MLFLIIAAVAFVIGLNLFAYLSLQVRTQLSYGCHRTDFWQAAFRFARNEYPDWSTWDLFTGSYALVYISTQA